MTAISAHVVLYWIGAALYALAFAAAFVRHQERRWSARLVAAALVVQAGSAAARWSVTGHPPIFGTFENTIAASWAIGLLTLLLATRTEQVHPADVRIMLAWALGILSYGLSFDRTPYPLTISERSLFVDVHVVFAWTAFAVMLATSMAGLLRLIEPDEARHALLDRTIIRGIGFGFAAFTGMMAVGSLYSYVLFADWYRWEIVGTTAFATWIAYGLTAHAYLMFGWRGRKIAWCVVGTLPLVIAVFWSWSLLSNTYHYFDIPDIRAW